MKTQKEQIMLAPRVSLPLNLGYASIIVTKTENSKPEQYFDDKGEPVSQYNGYCALLQDMMTRKALAPNEVQAFFSLQMKYFMLL